MNRLLIIGAGGHGVVVAEAAADAGLWNEIQFLDDDVSANAVLDFPVAGTVDQLNTLVDENSSVIWTRTQVSSLRSAITASDCLCARKSRAGDFISPRSFTPTPGSVLRRPFRPEPSCVPGPSSTPEQVWALPVFRTQVPLWITTA